MDPTEGASSDSGDTRGGGRPGSRELGVRETWGCGVERQTPRPKVGTGGGGRGAEAGNREQEHQEDG